MSEDQIWSIIMKLLNTIQRHTLGALQAVALFAILASVIMTSPQIDNLAQPAFVDLQGPVIVYLT